MQTLLPDRLDLPGAHSKDMLRLLVRDAHTLYAYWAVSDRKKGLASQHFECDYGQLTKELRLYDVTHLMFNGHNAHRTTCIRLTPEADNWYITGLEADRAYMADIGVRTWEGQFVPFVRSGSVQTPRDRPAGYGAPLVTVAAEASSPHPAIYIAPSGPEHFKSYLRL